MKKTLKTFGIVWLIGTACSFVPFLTMGAIFGQPAVVLSSLIIAVFFKLEMK